MSFPSPVAATLARPRRRRWPWAVAAAVLVVVLLAVVADRVALGIAERRAGDAIQTSQGLSSRPGVTVRGFPFLTQLAQRRFGEIDLTATGVQLGGSSTLDLARVDVQLHDVTLSDGFHTLHTAVADAQATLSFAELSRVLGAEVHAGPAGRIVASRSLEVLGATLHGSVSAGVRADSRAGLRFVDPRVSVAGRQVPQAAVTAFSRLLAGAVSLAGLPFDVEVQGASVTPAGVQLRLSGRNLTYRTG